MKNIYAVSLFAFLVTTSLSHAQQAEDMRPRDLGMDMNKMSFENLDDDKSGDVSLEEFNKQVGTRFELADTDKNGTVTAVEMGVALDKIRLEQMAKRIIDRFDSNKDGVYTKDEMNAKQKEKYENFDKNKDGKLTKDEMPLKKQKFRPMPGNKGEVTTQ
jgi:Ca2+-binding EF-hand superfamily protein